MSDTLKAALRYAAQGRPVFPVEPRGKRPLTPHGLTDASVHAAEIRAWWCRWPDAGVAIRTGRVARLVVLDVDGEAGAAALRELERNHGRLPTTASVATPRGGAHYYFRSPGSLVRNSVGILGPGLDVRGDGGYVVAPPSLGANGRRYEVDESAPTAAIPDWLVQRLAAPQTPAQATQTSEWLAILGGVDAGQRNHQLSRLTGHLLRRYVDVDLTAALIHLVNERCRPPLDAGEVDRIVDSIAGLEARRRRSAA